jgi:hypothetical protein
MANAARLDTAQETITLAHCTVVGTMAGNHLVMVRGSAAPGGRVIGGPR